MIDIDFIEFYIKKMYFKKLEEYFEVNKSVASNWRNQFFYRFQFEIIQINMELYTFINKKTGDVIRFNK